MNDVIAPRRTTAETMHAIAAALDRYQEKHGAFATDMALDDAYWHLQAQSLTAQGSDGHVHRVQLHAAEGYGPNVILMRHRDLHAESWHVVTVRS